MSGTGCSLNPNSLVSKELLSLESLKGNYGHLIASSTVVILVLVANVSSIPAHNHGADLTDYCLQLALRNSKRGVRSDGPPHLGFYYG